MPTGPFIHAARLGGYYDLKYYKKCDHLIGNTPKIVDYLVKNKNIDLLINYSSLTPGLLLNYNDLFNKHKIKDTDYILLTLKKLLPAFKKDKNKTIINMSVFLIDEFFYNLIKENKNKIDFLLKHKSFIVNKINEFIIYNLNINSVLNSIELNLKNVR